MLKNKGRKKHAHYCELLSEFELCDKASVALYIYLFKIVKLTAATTYHLQKTATGVVILFVRLEMLGKMVDAPSKERYLYLRASGVTLVCRKFGNDFRLYLLVHNFTSVRQIRLKPWSIRGERITGY